MFLSLLMFLLLMWLMFLLFVDVVDVVVVVVVVVVTKQGGTHPRQIKEILRRNSFQTLFETLKRI